jgi:uncharacterized protein YjbI with pentapeptide repeats
MLSDGDVAGFNKEVERVGRADLTDADLRALDLREANLRGSDLRGAYLRDADLSGQDLSEANLAGASLFHAHISGALFPPGLAPEEIRLSLDFGTRLRVVR